MKYHRRERLKRRYRISKEIDDRYVDRLIRRGYSPQDAVGQLYFHHWDKWIHAPDPFIAALVKKSKGSMGEGRMILPNRIWFNAWGPKPK